MRKILVLFGATNNFPLIGNEASKETSISLGVIILKRLVLRNSPVDGRFG